jgi:hypothetical protein
VTFDPTSEGPQLAPALDLFQYQLKGVSFLPRQKQPNPATAIASPYPQMPYESISQERYEALMRTVSVAKLAASLPRSTMTTEAGATVEEVPDKFCDTAACSLDSL